MLFRVISVLLSILIALLNASFSDFMLEPKAMYILVSRSMSVNM